MKIVTSLNRSGPKPRTIQRKFKIRPTNLSICSPSIITPLKRCLMEGKPILKLPPKLDGSFVGITTNIVNGKAKSFYRFKNRKIISRNEKWIIPTKLSTQRVEWKRILYMSSLTTYLKTFLFKLKYKGKLKSRRALQEITDLYVILCRLAYWFITSLSYKVRSLINYIYRMYFKFCKKYSLKSRSLPFANIITKEFYYSRVTGINGYTDVYHPRVGKLF